MTELDENLCFAKNAVKVWRAWMVSKDQSESAKMYTKKSKEEAIHYFNEAYAMDASSLKEIPKYWHRYLKIELSPPKHQKTLFS